MVLKNNRKKPTLSANRRLELVRLATEPLKNVEVDYWEKHLIDYANLSGACAIIKELNGNSNEFYNELKLNFLNKSFNKTIETVFFLPNSKYIHIDSEVVKRLFFEGKDINEIVPENITKYIKKFLSEVKYECKQHIR